MVSGIDANDDSAGGDDDFVGPPMPGGGEGGSDEGGSEDDFVGPPALDDEAHAVGDGEGEDSFVGPPQADEPEPLGPVGGNDSGDPPGPYAPDDGEDVAENPAPAGDGDQGHGDPACEETLDPDEQICEPEGDPAAQEAESPSSEATPSGGAADPVQECPEEPEEVTVFDDEDGGERIYDVSKNRIDIVQKKKTDTVTFHYKGPNPPSTLEVTRNGKILPELIGSSRAGGVMFDLEVTYDPPDNPYTDIPRDLLRAVFTVNAPPDIYKVKGLPNTIEVRVFNPDQWKLSLNLPPVRGYKLGAQLSGDKVRTSLIKGKKSKSKADKEKSNDYKLTVTTESTKFDTTTSDKIVAKYNEDTKGMDGIKYGKLDLEKDPTGVDKMGRWGPKLLQVERNSIGVCPDLVDLVNGILSLLAMAAYIAKVVKSFTPKVGWYVDLEFKLFEGKYEMSWGWKEGGEAAVYYAIAFGIEMTIVELMAEFGIGAASGKVGFQLCVQLKGKVSAKLGVELREKSSDTQSLGDTQAVIEAGGYARFLGGDVVSIVGAVKSSVTLKLELFYNEKLGYYIDGAATWDGLECSLTITVGTYSRPKKLELAGKAEITKFRAPSGKKDKSMLGREFKTEVRLSAEFEKVVTDGWNLRVFEAKRVPTRPWYDLFQVTQPTIVLEAGRELRVAEIADMMAAAAWKHHKRVTFTEKVVEGIGHALRSDCDAIAVVEWGRDWMAVRELKSYLESSKFAAIMDDAVDIVKDYETKAGLNATK